MNRAALTIGLKEEPLPEQICPWLGDSVAIGTAIP